MADRCTCLLGADECDGQFGTFLPLGNGGSCAVRSCQKPAERHQPENERDVRWDDLGVKAADLPEPDCLAILTPNGSRLVPPGEAKGRKDAYRLFSEEQVRELLHSHGVGGPDGGQR